MSVSARCIAFGVLMFLYWVAAFGVAVMNVLAGLKQFPADRWWNVTWLREPGFRLGSPIHELLEKIPGWDYVFILGWPLYIALFITAVGMGTGAWLLPRWSRDGGCGASGRDRQWLRGSEIVRQMGGNHPFRG